MSRDIVAELVPLVSLLIPISGIVMVIFIVWFGERRKERENFHRTELLKRIAESQGDAAQKVLEMMREEENTAQIRRREGMKLGGLVTLAVGIALMLLLARLEPSEPVWLVGMIPALIGAALIIYIFFLAPRPKQEDRGMSKVL
jgi:hypothetical protein